MKHERPSEALSDAHLQEVTAGNLGTRQFAPQKPDADADPQVNEYMPTIGLAMPIPAGNADSKPGQRQGRLPQGLS